MPFQIEVEVRAEGYVRCTVAQVEEALRALDGKTDERSERLRASLRKRLLDLKE